jgi:hypothetical protein
MSAKTLLICHLLIWCPFLLPDGLLRCACPGRGLCLLFRSGFGRGGQRLAGWVSGGMHWVDPL